MVSERPVRTPAALIGMRANQISKTDPLPSVPVLGVRLARAYFPPLAARRVAAWVPRALTGDWWPSSRPTWSATPA